MAKVIIGIPVKNSGESFKEMIYSLVSSTSAYDKIVLAVGKDTNQESLDTIEWAKEYCSAIKVVDNKFESPLLAYNYLFNLAKEEKSDLFLTQTDVLFPQLYKRDWLNQMNQIAQNEQVGAITCINGGGVSGPDYINGFEWLGGWCSYYPNRTIELIGGYDKNFPFGWGVDIDHTYRIYKNGLKIVKVNYWVDHHMQNDRSHELNPESEKQKQDASKYFKQKYGL